MKILKIFFSLFFWRDRNELPESLLRYIKNEPVRIQNVQFMIRVIYQNVIRKVHESTVYFPLIKSYAAHMNGDNAAVHAKHDALIAIDV